MEKVSKVKVNNNLEESISKAVTEIGGFGKFVKAAETVLLKPNFNTADPFPASTDLRFLKIVVKLVLQENPKKVIIGDSCTMSENTRKVMNKIGAFDMEKIDKRIEVMPFDEHPWVRKEIPKGKYLKKVSVPKILDEVDRLILLPCLKTHFIAKFTGSLKLQVGIMKPSQRMFLHFMNVQGKIADLNTIVHPDLIIMDARKCFVTKGPSEGLVKEPNLILASESRVSTDIEGIKIIQSYPENCLDIKPEELPQIKRAKELGVK